MWIQFLLVAGVLVIGLFLARPTGGDSHLALRRLFMAAFVVVAIISILFPQWLSWIANSIGVGRGADLLLYALVLAFLVFVATTYRRNVQVNRRITLLAREIALTRADAEDALNASEAEAVPTAQPVDDHETAQSPPDRPVAAPPVVESPGERG